MSRILSPKKNAPDHDLVMTPEILAIDIVDHYLSDLDTTKLTILDPSSGSGAFFNNFPPCKKLKCELSEGTNFLLFNERVDWIITNPPWSRMREFLTHGMQIADNIVYLSILNHFTTKARLRDIREARFGIKELYGVDTPKTDDWPQSGFQLVAAHLRRNYDGPIFLSGTLQPSVPQISCLRVSGDKHVCSL